MDAEIEKSRTNEIVSLHGEIIGCPRSMIKRASKERRLF